MRSDLSISWLNYAPSNLQHDRDIDKGLKIVSQYCEMKEKNLSSVDKKLLQWGLENYSRVVEVPENPKQITLEEILKYDFFNS